MAPSLFRFPRNPRTRKTAANSLSAEVRTGAGDKRSYLFRPPSLTQPMDVETYEQAIIKAMGDAGLPGPLHRSRRRGRLVSEEPQKFLTDAELKKWNDAIAEYHEREGKQRV